MSSITFKPYEPQYFDQVIALGNHVHGDNYLDLKSAESLYHSSFSDNINASWVAFDGDKLVGFRLTVAAQNWQVDEWCTPEKWPFDKTQVCYFKCNTVDENYRGYGLGSKLLHCSIEQAQKQGSKAGLAHIWLASPGNSAYRYFSKCGGVTIQEHPGKWTKLAIEEGYDCPVCPGICECVAAEMLLDFNRKR